MSAVTAALFKTPEIVLDYLVDLLSFNSDPLGLRFVGYGEERLIPEYPAVLVAPGSLIRELHATHTFQLVFAMELWIYHAKLSESHRIRTKLDLELVTAVRELLHDNLTCRTLTGEKQAIFSYVNAEDPAIIRRPRNEAVVGTRIEWNALSQERFG